MQLSYLVALLTDWHFKLGENGYLFSVQENGQPFLEHISLLVPEDELQNLPARVRDQEGGVPVAVANKEGAPVVLTVEQVVLKTSDSTVQSLCILRIYGERE